jgi:hypothetical protein
MRCMLKPLFMLLAATTLFTAVSAASTDVKTLPAGTRFYLVTDQAVSSKRGESDAGMPVMCRVWRDVELNGTLFIKGGTPARCRVDQIKRSNMGGIEGKVAIGGVETRSVTGENVMLQGGYNKEGSGRKAAVWTAGLLLFFPILFVPGGAAELPPGTVFDVSTVNNVIVTVEGAARPRLNLGSMMSDASAEILLDEFLAQKKPEYLKVRLTVPGDEIKTDSILIDSVNGKNVEPIKMTVIDAKAEDGEVTAICEVKLKPLAKHFQKGVNRFEVAYLGGAERSAAEVILDVQM